MSNLEPGLAAPANTPSDFALQFVPNETAKPIADYDRIMRALRNAHDAGDVAAAKRLAAMAKRAKETAQAPEPSPVSQKSEPVAPSHGGGMSAAALDGAMLGFGDEYLAGLSAVLGVQPDGEGGANWFQYDRPLRERYDVARDAIRDEQVNYAQQNPGRALASEMAGAVLGPGKGAGSFVNKGATTGARIARGGLSGGGTAASYGFGEGEGGFSQRASAAASSAPLGAVGGSGFTAVGQGFARVAQKLRGSESAQAVVPTMESLRATADQLYAKATQSGAAVPSNRVASMVKAARARVVKDGYDAQLHPRVRAVLNRLDDEAGDKSIAEMEILRRVAANAAASLQPDERRLAMKVIEEVDRAAKSIKGSAEVLPEARAVWARMRRLETIEEAIEKASTYASFERGLQNQFRSLLRNPKRLRGFNKEEIKAIRQVAKGSTTQRGLEMIGRLLSINTLPGTAATGAAAFGGAGLGAAAIPATGFATKSAADAMVRSAAERARQTVATGGVTPRLPQNPLLNALAPSASAENELRNYLLNAPGGSSQ